MVRFLRIESSIATDARTSRHNLMSEEVGAFVDMHSNTSRNVLLSLVRPNRVIAHIVNNLGRSERASSHDNA
jgi:hypothetical protein